MYKEYKLIDIPFAEKQLEEFFGGLLLCSWVVSPVLMSIEPESVCSEDIFSNETMVLFIHDL